MSSRVSNIMENVKEIGETQNEIEIAYVPEGSDHIHEFEEKEGYLVDSRETGRQDVKLAPDGHTILIPQPSDNPHDPLNWSRFRKNLLLIIITATAFLPDYSSATGAPELFPQASVWHLTPDHVNHSQAGNVFMLGIGALFTVTLSSYFGRLPVLFWFLLMAFITAAWCAGARSFESFMAARILNGFFGVVAEAGGQMYINDMFFFHERGRKLNAWLTPLILSPLLSPMLGFFILTTQPWPLPWWICFAITGTCFFLVLIFFDETYYDRRIPAHQQPARKSRILRIIGFEQWQSRELRNTFCQSLLRPVRVIAKPTICVSVLYNFLTFSWVVGIVNTLGVFLTTHYKFGPLSLGYFFFAPVIGTLLGGVTGHWLHDFIASLYVKRHSGRFDPEGRLVGIWVATPFMIIGLVLIGFALEEGYHYMIVAVGWSLYIFGIMIATVTVNSYTLDCYPEASGEAGAWLICGRTVCGFIISYEQIPWADAAGTKTTFAIQAGLCVVGFLLMAGLQVYGKKLRMWSGKLSFQTI